MASRSSGIGANAAVFSIVNSVLLRPLPYPQPDRLVVIRETAGIRPEPMSANPMHFLEWEREGAAFERVALVNPGDVTLAGVGDPERVRASLVTPSFFTMLGVRAQLGRTFTPDEGQPGGPAVVLIGDGLWRRRFGGAPDVIGAAITVDGVASTVVGVLPAAFRDHVSPGAGHIDVYRPWAVVPQPWWRWTGDFSYLALGRLRDGVSAQAALDELNAIQAAIAGERFDGDWADVDLGATLVPLHTWVTGESRDGLLLLLAAVGAALLVACLNIANLTLVRATRRSREAGLRSALGASRLAILRGALTESALLAAAGVAAGAGLAVVFLRFGALSAPASLPRAEDLHVDPVVLLFAAGLGLVSAMVFGLVPALRMIRLDPQEALLGRGHGPQNRPGRQAKVDPREPAGRGHHRQHRCRHQQADAGHRGRHHERFDDELKRPFCHTVVLKIYTLLEHFSEDWAHTGQAGGHQRMVAVGRLGS